MLDTHEVTPSNTGSAAASAAHNREHRLVVDARWCSVHEKRLRAYWEKGCRIAQHDMIDLELHAAGYIAFRESEHNRYSTVDLLPAGISRLVDARMARITRQSEHDSFASRLAAWLRAQGRMTWENIGFDVHRQVIGEDYKRMDIVRPDVFSIIPSHDIKRIAPAIYEVKVSRADFLSDLAKSIKRETYARIAGAVYYAAPQGLLNAHEIPDGFGLLVETTNGKFVAEKKVRAKRIELGTRELLNLVMKPGAIDPIV